MIILLFSVLDVPNLLRNTAKKTCLADRHIMTLLLSCELFLSPLSPFFLFSTFLLLRQFSLQIVGLLHISVSRPTCFCFRQWGVWSATKKRKNGWSLAWNLWSQDCTFWWRSGYAKTRRRYVSTNSKSESGEFRGRGEKLGFVIIITMAVVYCSSSAVWSPACRLSTPSLQFVSLCMKEAFCCPTANQSRNRRALFVKWVSRTLAENREHDFYDEEEMVYLRPPGQCRHRPLSAYALFICCVSDRGCQTVVQTYRTSATKEKQEVSCGMQQQQEAFRGGVMILTRRSLVSLMGAAMALNAAASSAIAASIPLMVEPDLPRWKTASFKSSPAQQVSLPSSKILLLSSWSALWSYNCILIIVCRFRKTPSGVKIQGTTESIKKYILGGIDMIFLCLQWRLLQWPVDVSLRAETWQFWFFLRSRWRLWAWGKQWRPCWIQLCLSAFQWLLCLQVQVSWNYSAITLYNSISETVW